MWDINLHITPDYFGDIIAGLTNIFVRKTSDIPWKGTVITAIYWKVSTLHSHSSATTITIHVQNDHISSIQEQLILVNNSY